MAQGLTVVSLQGRLDSLLPKDAKWALEVVDLNTGEAVVSMGNSKNMMLVPGSLIKLVVSGAVLHHMNGGIEVTTAILNDGTISQGKIQGNLYLAGRGNALLSSSDMESAVKSIAHRGIRAVTGDIIADDAAFDSTALVRKRKGTGYAPASALGMDLHTAAVYVLPKKAGEPPEVGIEPMNNQVKLAISAVTVSGLRENIVITQVDDTSYKIEGEIPEGNRAVKRRFSLTEPALYAAGVLKTALKKEGIFVDGSVLKGKTPARAKLLAEIKSQKMSALLRDMNVNSLNVIADNLLLLLGGAAYGFPGTRDKGIQAINDFLALLGFSRDDYAIADGSGLSGDNAVSTRFLARYLQKLSKQPWFEVFRESLSRPGMDGKVREIGFIDNSYRVKTGKLENAFGLAGYGADRTGRRIAFSYIVNVNAADVKGLERSGAEIMRYMATEGVL